MATYTDGVAVFIQGEVLGQGVWNGLLILLGSRVHRDVEVRIVVSGHPAPLGELMV